MDLDIIFWIAIAAIYLLQGFLGRKKPKQGPVNHPAEGSLEDPFGGPVEGRADGSGASGSRYGSGSRSGSGSGSADSSPEMDSALEEIRSILTGEPRRDTSRNPEREPTRGPAMEPVRTAKTPSTQDVVLPPAHWETFDEMEPQSQPRPQHQPRPVGKKTPTRMLEPIMLDPMEDATADHPTLLRPTTDVAAMRKAVILSEILRPPVSKRRY